MASVHAGRTATCVLAALGLFSIAVPRAEAVEAFDGRIQAHGFLEMQIRGLSRDFEEELDLAQWYNVINVELEFDILPDGWGPFDLLQAYVRIEGRFDCLYYDACGIFPSARTYGNKSRNLPLRLRDAFDENYGGAIDANDRTRPAGLVTRVPEETRDPTPWVLDSVTELPITPLKVYGANPNPRRVQSPGVDYDPNLDNRDAVDPPGWAGMYARSYCPTNGARGTAEQPISCYTNRPELFDIEGRRGFPGFDTVFKIVGADGERGPNPDYFLADPDATVNELTTVTPSNRHVAYERALRGLAFERDDPAYVVLATKIDTSIIDAVDVGAIPPEELTQELAQDIVYGGDPEDPGYSEEDCENGYCGEIRDAGRLYTFDPIFDWKFTFRDKEGPAGGTGRTFMLAPWLPKNFFGSLAAASSRANPLRGRETPTKVNRAPIDPGDSRSLGERYHILDVASGVFDPSADCDTGACMYGADPVDPRLLKYEQILQQALVDQVAVGGVNPFLFPERFGLYPNYFLSQKFGGDFSGVVARFDPYTNRPIPGAPLSATNFIRQTLASGTPGYSSNTWPDTIAYTNIHATGGSGELPMRPGPDRSNLSKLDPLVAQGLYIPSRGLVDALSTQDFDEHEFNISHIDRAFNHGASQRDTYEVKEAYLDMEFLDSRLWVRAGIQNIVWGKTELFRTTDQFNPQDMAMASLPGLEESRIALLSARAVYSFYDVGPLEDVRFELAANFDRIKPADLGACGEPYTIDVVCSATVGLMFHGVGGVGLAGVDRPPSAWNDVKGVEFGGRVEFRWDRFSFAVTDFYGYDDFPYPDPIFFYERNVDPNTGRPRKAGATGPCENAAGFRVGSPGPQPILQAGNAVREFIGGDASAAPSGASTADIVEDDYGRRGEAYSILGIGIDEACLKPGGAAGGPNENRYDPDLAAADPADYAIYAADSSSPPDPDSYIYQTLGQWGLKGSSVDYALAYQPANQQLFAALCSMTITIAASLSAGECGFNIFGSPELLTQIGSPGQKERPFSEVITVLLAGDIDNSVMGAWQLIQQNTKSNRALVQIPAVPMNRDVRDGLVTATHRFLGAGGNPWSPGNRLTLDSTLTNEQKALLGCGPFFGTRCDSGAAGRPFGTPVEYAYWDFEQGGGIDPLNGEASAWLQSFPGIEGTGEVTPRVVPGIGAPVDPTDPNSPRGDVRVDTWVTWSDDTQPGTIGFEGGEYCTRYAPDSPYANEVGIVRLPGCRGVKSVTVNQEIDGDIGYRTVDVVFDAFYTPRQDGCIFSEYLKARDGTTWYAVRAVNEDGTTDGDAARIQGELNETCYNALEPSRDPEGIGRVGNVSLRSTHRWTADVPNPDNILTLPYTGPTSSKLGSRTLFHPLASCESAGVDLRGNLPFAYGSDAGFLCDFRFRNVEADFIDGHAQVFRSEMAAWSWNMLMLLVTTSCNTVTGGDQFSDPECFDPNDAWNIDRCSISTPQFCDNVKSFLAIGGLNRNDVRAGGNGRFGRRDFIWHSGGEAVLRYARRNVFGFSLDFAEDVSKTNWGMEFTWFGDMPFMNNNSYSAISDSQTLNLTISVDRPTFINFLNANRTFFFNTQWFFQYLLDYDKGFTGTTGPFNVLFTFAFFTGYFQDRLLPEMVTVYDFRSQSGGFLPSIQYRFNERFSVTFGINYFIGRGQFIPMPLRGLAPTENRAGANAYEDGAEFFISNIRHRDEAYMRIRWTF